MQKKVKQINLTHFFLRGLPAPEERDGGRACDCGPDEIGAAAKMGSVNYFLNTGLQKQVEVKVGRRVVGESSSRP